MPDPNLPLLEDAVQKLAPFLEEVVFVGGITLGLLITDAAAAPIRGTTDVDVVAEIITYADYMEFSERLRKAQFTEDAGEKPLTCRWHFGALTLDVLPLNKEVLGFTNRWYAPCARSRFNVYAAERPIDPRDYRALLPWDQDGSISGPWQYGLPSQPRPRGLCCSHRRTRHGSCRDYRIPTGSSGVSCSGRKISAHRITVSGCAPRFCLRQRARSAHCAKTYIGRRWNTRLREIREQISR
jgi:hypothetical protein